MSYISRRDPVCSNLSNKTNVKPRKQRLIENEKGNTGSNWSFCQNKIREGSSRLPMYLNNDAKELCVSV